MVSKSKTIFKYDYYRNTAGKNYNFFKYIFMPRKLKMLFWIRKCQFGSKSFRFFYRFMFSINKRNNNDMTWRTKIGEGLYLGHSGGRYINAEAIIGKNCNINQNVVIGQENRGKRKGSPEIGNNVWIGANSIIVGRIVIGNNVLIAPGAFVNFDVPDNSIVIGNPGKIIAKENPTESYINWVK